MRAEKLIAPQIKNYIDRHTQAIDWRAEAVSD